MKTDLFIQTRNQVQKDNDETTPQPQYNQLPLEWTERFRALPKTFKSQIRYILRAGGPTQEDLEIYNSLKTLIVIRRRQLAARGEGAGTSLPGTSGVAPEARVNLPGVTRATPGASASLPGVNRVTPVVRMKPVMTAEEEEVPDFSYEDQGEEDNDGTNNYRDLPTAYLDPEPTVNFSHEGLVLTDSPLNRELDDAAAKTPSPLQPNCHYSFPNIETPSPTQ